MTKISFVIAILAVVLQPFSLLGAPDVGAVSDTLFSDSFESGTFDAWDSADTSWRTVSTNAQDGSRRADYNGTGAVGELAKTVDATGYENVSLSFYYKRLDMKATDYGQIAYRVGGSETVLDTYFGEAGSADNDTEWQRVEVPLPDADGQSDISIMFRGFGSSASNTFKLDTVVLSADVAAPGDDTAPLVTLSDPVDGAINPTQIVIDAIDETGLSGVSLSVSNDTGVVDSCSDTTIAGPEYTLTCSSVAGLSDGSYTAAFYATDTSGNMSEPGSFDFTIDRTPPSLSVEIPQDGLVTNFGALHASGSADDALTGINRVEYVVEKTTGIAGSATEILYSGDANGTEKWEFNVLSLETGFYRITVTAYDLAGNERSQSHDIAVDSVQPAVSVIDPKVDNEIRAQDFSVMVNASDVDSGVVKVAAELFSGTQLLSYVDSCYESEMVAQALLDFTCDVDVSQLAAGNYVLSFGAEDAAGNQSEPVFWRFRILSGTIVVAPSVPGGNGSSGAASNGVVNRQAANTVILPRTSNATLSSTSFTKATASVSPNKQLPILPKSTPESGQVLAATSEQSSCSESIGVCQQWLVMAGVGVVTAGLLVGYVLVRRSKA